GAPQHRINVHLEDGVLGQQLELLVQNLQALFGNVVRHHIINADLQVLEAGIVEGLYAVAGEQVAVGNHSRDNPAFADVADNFFEFGMKQGLAAADGDDAGAKLTQAVDALKE